jgi:hypothetical protein
MELLHPGVYIQEIPSGVRPIEGASTSNAAFMGKAEMGPVGRAQLITSAAEFESRYGGFLSDSYLAHAVFHFFNNGGKKTYVVRVTGSGTATISIKDRKNDPAETLTIKAANEGAWGNKLDVVITNSREPGQRIYSPGIARQRDAFLAAALAGNAREPEHEPGLRQLRRESCGGELPLPRRRGDQDQPVNRTGGNQPERQTPGRQWRRRAQTGQKKWR